ncbi:C40 family peptidase [Hymenobacter cheonanensis]|uniref:C40 family peptidase n=1 Tax=Hymenobacter sp. CA2-7 TaxID=3063993 RepID=UPI0027143096|nr:NlpC/P60 family protein [Hymenobacter sp. CA2-7]MDO7888018.1 NlpC/P60 family protein [Hymenobacter sp. CA2-7]
MRSIWLIFGCLLLVLLGLRFWLPRRAAKPAAGSAPTAPAVVLVAQHLASPRPAPTGQRDSIVRFALRQVGTPYTWAGTSPLTGFDCSGFITYVFGRFGVPTPHATALLIGAGQAVPRAQAQPGDIVVFNGTAEGSTTPGHAGIVISALGETPLRFVHASSARRESGVKISQVENSGYERRFMQVRRVLGASPAGPAATTPRIAAASSRPELARPPAPVTSLPAASPKVKVDLAATLPARVAPVPVRLRPHARATAKATATRKRPTPARHAAAQKLVSSKKTTAKKQPTGQKALKAAAQTKPAHHSAKPKTR